MGGTSAAWIGGYDNTPIQLATFTDTDNAKATLANAIVSKGGTATSSMTFANLATAIEDINTGIDPTSIKYVLFTGSRTYSYDITNYSCVIIFLHLLSKGTAYIIFDKINFKYVDYASWSITSGLTNVNWHTYTNNSAMEFSSSTYSSYVKYNSSNNTITLTNGTSGLYMVALFIP